MSKQDLVELGTELAKEAHCRYCDRFDDSRSKCIMDIEIMAEAITQALRDVVEETAKSLHQQLAEKDRDLDAVLSTLNAHKEWENKYVELWVKLAEKDATICGMIELLKELSEYWNGSENERAMADALRYIEQRMIESLSLAPICPHKEELNRERGKKQAVVS